jgi:hypothetical protein
MKAQYNNYLKYVFSWTEYILLGNKKEGSIPVLLTSCMTGLQLAVLQLSIFVFICKRDYFKPAKQEVNGTAIHIYIYLYIYMHMCIYVYVYTYICIRRKKHIHIRHNSKTHTNASLSMYINVYTIYAIVCLHSNQDPPPIPGK